MGLFHIPLVPIKGREVTPVVKTPLGVIIYTAQVNGYDLVNIRYSSHSAGDDSYLFRWKLPEAEVELLLFRPAIPPNLQGRINDTWAGIWRLRALHSIDACYFSCNWQQGYSWTHGGPDSGEGLDAQTYDDGKTVVTIGTEDSQYIGNRAENKDWVPIQLKPTDPYNFADYVADGLRISCHGLETDDRCQFQYIIAWAHESDDVGHWLAVDREYKELLHLFHA